MSSQVPTFAVGDQFENYNLFNTKLQARLKLTNEEVAKTTYSKSIKYCNKRNAHKKLREDLEYKVLGIRCKQSGIFKSRGTIRKTKSKKTGCSFFIKLKYNCFCDALEVIDLNLEHNHELSQFANTANRKPSDEEITQITKLRALGLPSGKIRAYLQNATGRDFTRKEIHNIARKGRNKGIVIKEEDVHKTGVVDIINSHLDLSAIEKYEAADTMCALEESLAITPDHCYTEEVTAASSVSSQCARLSKDFKTEFPSSVTTSEGHIVIEVMEPHSELSDSEPQRVVFKVEKEPVELPNQLIHMTKDDVRNWLYQNGLQRFSDAFSELDGRLLLELKKMKAAAQEFYLTNLKEQFQMNLIEVLKFNAALDSLD